VGLVGLVEYNPGVGSSRLAGWSDVALAILLVLAPLTKGVGTVDAPPAWCAVYKETIRNRSCSALPLLVKE
jgi:hypothetical protein